MAENWEQEVEAIIEDDEAFALFTRLVPRSVDARLRVSADKERLIRIILGHVNRVFFQDGYPVEDALWMAFWLGAAWPKIRKEEP